MNPTKSEHSCTNGRDTLKRGAYYEREGKRKRAATSQPETALKVLEGEVWGGPHRRICRTEGHCGDLRNIEEDVFESINLHA